VRPASQKTYPIYDQNLWFSPTLFMTWTKIQHPFNDRCDWHSCPKQNLWAFVDGLVDNDEKVAPSKKHTQFKTRVKKTYPFETKMTKIDTLFMTKTAEKPYLYNPCKGVPPPPPPRELNSGTRFNLKWISGKGRYRDLYTLFLYIRMYLYKNIGAEN